MKIAWRVCDMKPNTLNLCLGKLGKPLLNNQIFLTKILYGKNGRQKLMRLFFTQMHAENTPTYFMLVNIYFQKRSLNYFENYIKYLINGRLKRPFYSNKIWRPGISQRGRRPKGRERGKASAWSARTDPWGSPSDPALILTFLTPFLRPATQAIQEYIKISDLVSAQFLLFPNIQEVSAGADQHTHLG